MAIGDNQLNIFVLEVGFITTDSLSGVSVATLASVHPLVVAPSDISYSDTSKSSVVALPEGSHVTVGGRAPRVVSISGTFGGPDAKGFVGYVGTNDILFQRFWNEVVRMGDALTQGQVEAAIDILSGSPQISGTARLYDPERSVPYVNFYDFWNDKAFSVIVESWQPSRSASRGSASGMVSYRLTLREAGELVSGGAQTVIEALLDGATFLDTLADVVDSYSPSNVLGSFLAVGAVGADLISDLVNSVTAAAADVQALLNGSVTSSTLDPAYLQNVQDLQTSCEDLAEQLAVARTAVQSDGATAAWASSPGEGTNLDREAYEVESSLRRTAAAAETLRRMGAFYGMDQAAWEAFLSSSGTRGAIDTRGSITHVVGATDTLASLERRYGVTAERILAANDALPAELLVLGRTIVIPLRRAATTSTFQRDLPVYGSHAGRAAWGVDIDAELHATARGDFAVVEEEDCVEQGVAILIADREAYILAGVQRVPEKAAAGYLSRQYQAALRTDRRILGTPTVEVTSSATGYEVAVTAELINGGQIRTGV